MQTARLERNGKEKKQRKKTRRKKQKRKDEEKGRKKSKNWQNVSFRVFLSNVHSEEKSCGLHADKSASVIKRDKEREGERERERESVVHTWLRRTHYGIETRYFVSRENPRFEVTLTAAKTNKQILLASTRKWRINKCIFIRVVLRVDAIPSILASFLILVYGLHLLIFKYLWKYLRRNVLGMYRVWNFIDITIININ